MSLPLSFYTPPMMRLCIAWDNSLNKPTHVLEYIRSLKSAPLAYFLVEIAAPLLGLIITRICFHSIPGAILLSVATLTTLTTCATSPRALHLFFPEEFAPIQAHRFFCKQKSLLKLLQWFIILMNGLFLYGGPPSPLLHISMPLLTIACIVWPILLYIDKDYSIIKNYLCHKKINQALWVYSTFNFFMRSLESLESLYIKTNTSWACYRQLAMCASLTLLCKDSNTEPKECKQSSKIQQRAHTTFCLGLLAYHVFAVWLEPISTNIIMAFLVSTHILFVLFIDAQQETNHNNSTLRLQELLDIHKKNDQLEGTTEAKQKKTQKILKKRLQQLQKQSPVAPWYFPLRIVLHTLIGASHLFISLPTQPDLALLRIFFLSQIISTTTDSVLKQIEASERERWWCNIESLQKKKQNRKKKKA